VVRGAHQAPAYELRRNGLCVAFEKVNGANRFRLLTMTRQHLYAAILAAAQREGVEIVRRSPAVSARPQGILQLAHGRRLPAELVIAADSVRSCVRDSLGLAGKRRKYQDGIIRIVLENTDLIGGEWNHVIAGPSNRGRCVSSTHPARKGDANLA
jgi:2-methyl-3-hydroxypyridine 5-carboxylic acid dioxygenase